MKNLLYLVIMFMSLHISFAQQGLITGKLIDETTNKPVAAKVTFLGSDGSLNKVNSNAIDGEFQIVVKKNTDYDIIVEKYLVPSENRTYSTPNFSEYTEFNKTFYVKKLESGLKLAEFNTFNPNQSEINKHNSGHFKFLSEFLKQQLGTTVEIIVSSSDSHFKAKTITEEQIVKGKKKKVKVKLSEKDIALELIKSRIDAIKATLKEFKVPERNIVFTENVVITKPVPKKKTKGKTEINNNSNPNYDTEIKISKVSSL